MRYKKESKKLTLKVLKNISKPDTGILFTVPVDFVEGVNNL